MPRQRASPLLREGIAQSYVQRHAVCSAAICLAGGLFPLTDDNSSADRQGDQLDIEPFGIVMRTRRTEFGPEGTVALAGNDEHFVSRPFRFRG